MSVAPARLRVAAIDFLNPAPLMWDFDHSPRASILARRYALRYTMPAQCAADLASGNADLGLIPVAALDQDLAVVPGCAIASRNQVRSILLLVRQRTAASLENVRSVALDAASRSSIAYTQVLFRHFLGTDPAFFQGSPDPIAGLARADAALVIGDPALLAREQHSAIEAEFGPCLWIDLAEEWHRRTGLPWVAAVWAVREESLRRASLSSPELIGDLQQSRDAGLANLEPLVAEWAPRIALPPKTIRAYFTDNIYYHLDVPCLTAIALFRRLAAQVDALPALGEMRLLSEIAEAAT